jgi:malonyl-CoA O-methyltransferase
MTLHTLIDPAKTFRRWSSALAPGGFLMCSGLGPDSLKELRPIYHDMGWGAPAASFMDMHDMGDLLVHAGFTEPVMDMEHLTLSWSTAESLLSELRTWGGNVSQQRLAVMRTPAWRNRLLTLLAKHLTGPDGRLSLTLEIIYGHAIQPETRVAVGKETRINLSDMKRWLKK